MKKNASKRSLHIHMCEDSPQGPSMECMNGSRLHEEGCIQAREVCVRLASGFFHTAWTPTCKESNHIQQTSLS